ncbi:semaphorin-4G [Rana temporaria]|uniref:semaphorin-4G n=1 Tax=Rana temporaria TaxID=8407 RepID=UPI001AADEB6F|nr:semaphorin-4G [Rana temporaria]XP_040217835.1 semaphorin-4G [Rana temporaria]
MKRHVACYFVALCAMTIGYTSKRSAADLDATPRKTVTYNELSDAKRFSDKVKNYTTLLLEDENGIIFVGARGAIFSLNATDISHRSRRTINWEVTAEETKTCHSKGKNIQTECFNHIRLLQRVNETHLYVCGTHAFAPQCCYIDVKTFVLPLTCDDGREKCPFDPVIGYTGFLIDGVLYTASGYGFYSAPDIRKNVSVLHTLKTEASPLQWLNDAEFVSSSLVQESVNSAIGDDDKIYYFFNEQVKEESSEFLANTKVARVARVCKSDMGGKKILQRKWTSFLKARLACFMPYYETLKSAYTLEVGAWNTTIFYGAFILQWRNMEASAVCRYSITDIHDVFEGDYMEYQNNLRKWSRYQGNPPRPRPGSCITNELRSSNYTTSQDLPNNVLDFVKLHPLMAEAVKSIDKQPVLMKKNIIYTQIAADRVTALDKEQYDVLFLGTDNGWIHKAVVIKSQVHIIEEIQIFKKSQPVEKLVISKKQNSLYIGAQSGVLQLPLSGCSRSTSCYDCILARNPYCGWDGKVCREPRTSQDMVQMTQDMQNGNGGCLNNTDQVVPMKKLRTVLKGDDVLLQCDLWSNLAKPLWLVNGTDPLEEDDGRLRVGIDGLLITDALLEYSGEYDCYSEENGLQSIIASYNVSVLLQLPKPSDATPNNQLPTPAPRSSSKLEFVYISIITILGGLCLVLSIVLLYVSCQQKRKGKYAMRNSRITSVELQTVSSNFKDKSEEHPHYSDGCLQIIPGEAPTASPIKTNPPPPPPPPPLPSEFTNGISTLPNMLRKMNGNSYMLLRQSEEASSPLYNSFTEELSKILEKRKHTQLVEKLDESSV